MIPETNRDEMLQIDLCNGQVRVLLCETTQTVQRCADLHSTTPVCTAALGRLLTGGVDGRLRNAHVPDQRDAGVPAQDA